MGRRFRFPACHHLSKLPFLFSYLCPTASSQQVPRIRRNRSSLAFFFPSPSPLLSRRGGTLPSFFPSFCRCSSNWIQCNRWSVFVVGGAKKVSHFGFTQCALSGQGCKGCKMLTHTENEKIYYFISR